jgi:hypothetical protein
MPARTRRPWGPALALALLPWGLLSGCATRTRVVYVAAPPPPPVVEVVPVQPAPTYVWVQGHHTWNGANYVWVSGRWVVRPYGKTRYIPGRWQQGRGGWFWVEEHWR